MSFANHLYNEGIKTRTENGAVAFSTTKSAVLDLFALGGSARNLCEHELNKLLFAAFSEDIELGMRTLFYLSDIREGQGERRLFKQGLRVLIDNFDQKYVERALSTVPFYGRWDYLLDVAFDTTYKTFALNLIKDEVNSSLESGKTSLVFKWLPTAKNYPRLAKAISNHLGISVKEYRQMLSAQREALRVTERLMSDQNWSEIDYSKVPSVAAKNYRNAFHTQDGERYRQYLEDLSNPDKPEVKINASVLYPHDIVHAYTKGWRIDTNVDQTLEAQWKSLKDYLVNAKGSFLPMVDVSGSMFTKIGRTSLSAFDVATSLGIYIAERNKGDFNDLFLTFASNPQMEKLKGTTLRDKLHNMQYANWGMSTNLEAAFELILQTALKNNTPTEDLPKTLIILSDMQFNESQYSQKFQETTHEVLRRRYAENGYEIPSIVYWNLCGRNVQSPVTMDENKTVLVSGFSPVILQTVLDGEISNPYDMMLKVIMNERYDLAVV